MGDLTEGKQIAEATPGAAVREALATAEEAIKRLTTTITEEEKSLAGHKADLADWERRRARYNRGLGYNGDGSAPKPRTRKPRVAYVITGAGDAAIGGGGEMDDAGEPNAAGDGPDEREAVAS